MIVGDLHLVVDYDPVDERFFFSLGREFTVSHRISIDEMKTVIEFLQKKVSAVEKEE